MKEIEFLFSDASHIFDDPTYFEKVAKEYNLDTSANNCFFVGSISIQNEKFNDFLEYAKSGDIEHLLEYSEIDSDMCCAFLVKQLDESHSYILFVVQLADFDHHTLIVVIKLIDDITVTGIKSSINEDMEKEMQKELDEIMKFPWFKIIKVAIITAVRLKAAEIKG